MAKGPRGPVTVAWPLPLEATPADPAGCAPSGVTGGVWRARAGQATRAKLESDGIPVITEHQATRSSHIRLYQGTGPLQVCGPLDYQATAPVSRARNVAGD